MTIVGWLENKKNAFSRKKTLDGGASVFGKTMKRTKLLTQSNPIHGWIQSMSSSGPLCKCLFNTRYDSLINSQLER